MCLLPLYFPDFSTKKQVCNPDFEKELLYDGIHVDVIHADRSQQQRENTVRAFRSAVLIVSLAI